jgi:hypothetical protein
MSDYAVISSGLTETTAPKRVEPVEAVARREDSPPEASKARPRIVGAPDPARYRLTIEKGAGGFIYKTLDRETGEVIRQLPREEVVRLSERADYRIGGVFDIEA